MKTIVTSFFLLTLLPMGWSQTVPQEQQRLAQALYSLWENLSPTQQDRAGYAFDDTARSQWTNLPVGLVPRPGIALGDLNNAQRILLHQALSQTFSSQGYLKTTGVFHLDDLLNVMMDSLAEQGKMNATQRQRMADLQWAHGNFFLSFYGEPAGKDPWAFQLGGHHLALNLTFVGDELDVTPFFIGSDPAVYPLSDYAGWRVLGQEEDLGLLLVQSLNANQQETATLSREVPGDILTHPESGKRLLEYEGLKASTFNETQKVLLRYLLEEYVHNLSHSKAHVEMQKILDAGIDEIYFAWIGPYEETEPHYYMLNGPSFLIEFDNRGNHIHCIWREKGNEFGEDLLRQHYQSVPHKNR